MDDQMTDGSAARIEIDGRPATMEQLSAAALATYGHFTAMQVRDRRVRGLDLHLARLDVANREMFGAAVDPGQIRAHVRHALGEGILDASVRVHLYETPGGIPVMVTVRPPGGMQARPWRLWPVPYQRPAAHIKHLGDFGQSYYRRLALRNGFDEALLTGTGGVISEGSITNVGFFDGDAVLWPDAPVLHGTTMQILERTLPGHGVPTRRIPVHTADLGSFAAVFVANSRGIAPVGQVGDLVLATASTLIKTLAHAWESAAWDPI
jgi:branched-subunit amino acid aminotransferase/4-amino-4-deoxychorismate lyase